VSGTGVTPGDALERFPLTECDPGDENDFPILHRGDAAILTLLHGRGALRGDPPESHAPPTELGR
jgi:hypothetical protein